MSNQLPRELISIINRKSYAAGLIYSKQEKQRLILELVQLKEKGANSDQLKQYLMIDSTLPVINH